MLRKSYKIVIYKSSMGNNHNNASYKRRDLKTCLQLKGAPAIFSMKEVESWYINFLHQSESLENKKISLEQFKYILSKTFGLEDAAVFADHLFRTFDEDNDGYVDSTELWMALCITCAGSFEDKIKWAFKVYDVDGDGLITVDELINILKSAYGISGKSSDPDLSMEHMAHALIDKIDKNNDGKVSQEEFIKFSKKDPIFLKILRCDIKKR